MNSQTDWNWRLVFTGTNTRHRKSLFTRAKPIFHCPRVMCPFVCTPSVYIYEWTHTENRAKHWGQACEQERERDSNQVISLCCVRKIVAGRLLRIIHMHTNIHLPVSPPGSYSNCNCWWVSRWRAQWPAAVCVRPVHPHLNFSAGTKRYSKWMKRAWSLFDAFALCSVRCRLGSWEGYLCFLFGRQLSSVCAKRWDTCGTIKRWHVSKTALFISWPG